MFLINRNVLNRILLNRITTSFSLHRTYKMTSDLSASDFIEIFNREYETKHRLYEDNFWATKMNLSGIYLYLYLYYNITYFLFIYFLFLSYFFLSTYH